MTNPYYKGWVHGRLLVAALAALGLLVWAWPQDEPPRTNRTLPQRKAPTRTQQTDGDVSDNVSGEEHGTDAVEPRILGTTEPGARVQLFRYPPDKSLGSGRADANGEFDLLAPYDGLVLVRADLAGFVASWKFARTGESVSLPMYRSRTAKHWVVDPEGNPIAGARVAAVVRLRTVDARQRWLEIERAHARTDSRGTASLSMGPDDALSIEADGFQSVVRRSPSLTSRRGVATYTLTPAPPLTVSVVDEAGRAVPGADVFRDAIARPNTLDVLDLLVRQLGDQYTTDARGRAQPEISLDREYIVFARARALVSASRRVAAGQGEITLVLGPPATVRGRVEPVVPLARITVADRETTAADDGRFEVTGLPPGRHTLAVSEAGYPRSEEIEVELRKGEILTVLVASLAREPVSFVTLRPTEPDGSPATLDSHVRTRPDWSRNDGMQFEFRVAPGTEIEFLAPFRTTFRTTGSRGKLQTAPMRPLVRFRVRGVADCAIERASHIENDLWQHRERPGTPLRWHAQSPGRSGSGTLAAPRDGQVIDLRLPRTASIRGRLVNTVGESVRASATASVESVYRSVESALVADVYGTFERSGLEPGRTLVSFFADDDESVCLALQFVTLHPGETVDLGAIVVPTFVPVRGRVLDQAGQAMGGTLVTLIDPERGFIGRTRTGPNGRFIVDAPKGTRTIAHARHPDGRAALALNGPFNLTLGPAGTLEVRYGFHRATVAVRTHNGTLLHRSELPLRLALPPGDYLVVPEEKGDEPRRVRIKANETVTLGE